LLAFAVPQTGFSMQMLAVIYLFIYLTFANIDNKNIVRRPDCRTTRQNDCTYGSPLKHTNIKITINITTQAGRTDKDRCT